MAKLEPVSFTAKNGKKVILRSPKEGEGAELLETVRRVLASSEHLLTEPEEFKYTEEQENDMIRTYLAHPDKIIIVPECEGKIVGMLDFTVGSRRRNSHTGDFGTSLLPEFHGHGIGEGMLRSLLGWARENPRVERVSLRVHSKNEPAIRLYQKVGFREEGRELRGVKLGDGRYDDVLIMACLVD